MEERQIGKDKRWKKKCKRKTKENKELIAPYDDGRIGGRDIKEGTEWSKKKKERKWWRKNFKKRNVIEGIKRQNFFFLINRYTWHDEKARQNCVSKMEDDVML